MCDSVSEDDGKKKQETVQAVMLLSQRAPLKFRNQPFQGCSKNQLAFCKESFF